VSLWGDAGAKLDTVSLINYGQYETDFGFSRDWSYLQPGMDPGSITVCLELYYVVKARDIVGSEIPRKLVRF